MQKVPSILDMARNLIMTLIMLLIAVGAAIAIGMVFTEGEAKDSLRYGFGLAVGAFIPMVAGLVVVSILKLVSLRKQD